MYHPFPVCLFQGIANLNEESQRPAPGEAARGISLGFGQLPQCVALDEVHHHEQQPVIGLIEVEGVDGVRVGEPGDYSGFVEEAGHHVGIGAKLSPQHLYRNRSSQDQVGGLVDRSETAVAQRRLQFILLP